MRSVGGRGRQEWKDVSARFVGGRRSSERTGIGVFDDDESCGMDCDVMAYV